MKPRRWKMEVGGWRARSFLECGGPPPLSSPCGRALCQSARGLAQSRSWRLALLLGFIILHSSFCLRAWGQSYSIDWYKIAGGGATSTGGVYAVSGTIGQPDAGGPMTNGQYSVVGGFWALPIAVQTPSAPTLYITPAAPGYAKISWTPNTPGFALQETPDVSPTNWVNSASTTNNPATVPAALPRRFYRLLKTGP